MHAYSHAHMHAWIHEYINTYMNTYMNTCILTCMLNCLHIHPALYCIVLCLLCTHFARIASALCYQSLQELRPLYFFLDPLSCAKWRGQWLTRLTVSWETRNLRVIPSYTNWRDWSWSQPVWHRMEIAQFSTSTSEHSRIWSTCTTWSNVINWGASSRPSSIVFFLHRRPNTEWRHLNGWRTSTNVFSNTC